MLTAVEEIWVHTPEGSTARSWQEVSCEIRKPGPEPRYILFAIGIFRFLGHWYEHRAPAHLSAKRRIMCCFCNTGIKVLCHNVRFWLMTFIPKVILILTQSLTNPPQFIALGEGSLRLNSDMLLFLCSFWFMKLYGEAVDTPFPSL